MESIAHCYRVERIAPVIAKRLHCVRWKLRMLNAAQRVDDLRIPPANRLEKLKGRRSGQYSIRINDQWRICFAWRDGQCTDVEIVDYH